jgi:hypothetical protein
MALVPFRNIKRPLVINSLFSPFQLLLRQYYYLSIRLKKSF